MPKAEGTLLKKGPKECESQGTRKFAKRLCLLGILEATPMKSLQYDCLNMKWTRTIRHGRYLWPARTYSTCTSSKTGHDLISLSKNEYREIMNMLAYTSGGL